jgi:hypothetical protein
MSANDQMQGGIAEATRLTRQGRLDEATAAIQRAVGGTFVPPQEPVSCPAPSPNLLNHSVGNHSVATPLRTRMARASYVAVPEGGRFVERSYTNNAGTRTYKLYIPGGYVGDAVPLIVMLHGCTQSPDDFATGTRMNELAEERTFLVAYPASRGGPTCRSAETGFRPPTSSAVGENHPSSQE